MDTAQVAELMQKIQADPRTSPRSSRSPTSTTRRATSRPPATFLEKILAIDPKNVTALLALGAAQFNQGNSADAEKQWRAVLAIDPKNVEAHYDLGFMYLSQNPPDVANVKLEWGEVIAIAPTSDVAKTVATHLASLDGSPAPSGAAPASGAPQGSVAPASPAASPTASPLAERELTMAAGAGIGILIAFLGGIVSFASPCCLPLVPAYVGYMVGTSAGRRSRPGVGRPSTRRSPSCSASRPCSSPCGRRSA